MAWSTFWDKLREEVKRHQCSHLHIAWHHHKLHVSDWTGCFSTERQQFQRVFNEAEELQLGEFTTYAYGKSLVQLINWCMCVGWSAWVDNPSLGAQEQPVLAGGWLYSRLRGAHALLLACDSSR
jgi:hypothetical protein